MATTPTTPVAAAALEARRSAVRRLAGEAADARLNAAIAERLAERPDHPRTADEATDADAEAAQKAADATAAAEAAGVTLPTSKMSPERRDTLRELLAQWKQLRAVHADMADNPDAYGGVDFGGSPIDVDAQRAMVVEYDVGIEVLAAELAS